MSVEKTAIRVATIGAFPETLTDLLERRLAAVYSRGVVRETTDFDLDVALDTARHQYDSTILLETLHAGLPADESKVIGVTTVDLFIPVFTFVFGEAQLGGRVALMSICRLRNGFYGLPDDQSLLEERAVKEAVHELGHTFGLVHCANPVCVMNASPGVEEVDIKGYDFCHSCRRMINARGFVTPH
jgi:archaemetzincin